MAAMPNYQLCYATQIKINGDNWFSWLMTRLADDPCNPSCLYQSVVFRQGTTNIWQFRSVTLCEAQKMVTEATFLSSQTVVCLVCFISMANTRAFLYSQSVRRLNPDIQCEEPQSNDAWINTFQWAVQMRMQVKAHHAFVHNHGCITAGGRRCFQCDLISRNTHCSFCDKRTTATQPMGHRLLYC